MSLLRYNGKLIVKGGKFTIINIPSEAPAISTLRNFLTGIQAFMADWDRLPTTQAELEDYVLLNPTEYYTFAYHFVDVSLAYCNATSAHPLIHSYTRTVSWSGGMLNDITCKKLGTTPPGCADYIGGVLSCQVGTEEV